MTPTMPHEDGKKVGDDVAELMLLYAMRGWSEWKDAAADLKSKAKDCLSAAGIVEKEGDVKAVIAGNGGHGPMFIPMPKSGGRPGFEHSFFLPRSVDGALKSLTLFMLVSRAQRSNLCFRFECENKSTSRHNYTHVQLTKDLFALELTCESLGVPNWLPTRYPAFPITARNSLELFLAMIVSVHGFHGGADDLLVKIYQERPRSNSVQEHLRRLQRMLCVLE